MRSKEPFFASIQQFYEGIAIGHIIGSFTVPAFNLRTLTFDAAKALFRAAKKAGSGAFIIELARTEMEYTNQPPKEYAKAILKAAKKEKWEGPIFLQADHFALKNDSAKDIKELEQLIKQSIKSDFYNIDIDCSVLGKEQNIGKTIHFLDFIRKNQPKNIAISLGAEIDRIGGDDTTQEELSSFLSKIKIESGVRKIRGIIKVACQVGTFHGGNVLPNGELEDIKIDFAKLKQLSEIAKSYGMAGIVQHGASTLRDENFQEFPKAGILEIHLSTGLQNIVLDSLAFPADLKDKMDKWIFDNFKTERQKYQTDNQFLYKLRKRALGKFKREIAAIPQKNIDKICEELEARFDFFFKSCNVGSTKALVQNIYNLK